MTFINEYFEIFKILLLLQRYLRIIVTRYYLYNFFAERLLRIEHCGTKGRLLFFFFFLTDVIRIEKRSDTYFGVYYNY